MLSLAIPFFCTIVCLSKQTDKCINPHLWKPFYLRKPIENCLFKFLSNVLIVLPSIACTALLRNCNNCMSLRFLSNKECLSDLNNRPTLPTVTSALSYIAFDFHKECSHMRWERLQILVDAVAETQDEYRY